MKFDFNIQKIEFNFKTFGSAKIDLIFNGVSAKELPISKNIKKINHVRINFTKEDPADVNSFARLDGLLINGFDLKDNFKTLPYKIDLNKHKVDTDVIHNNLYFGYEGHMDFELEHNDDLLSKAAWTIADKEFSPIKWPLKGQQYRNKDFHNVRRDAIYMFTGCHPPNTKDIIDQTKDLRLGDLGDPLELSADREVIEEWINKSARINLRNFSVMKNFTVSSGTTESLNSFIHSADEIYMPSKTYYHNGEVLEGKGIKVKDVFIDTLVPNANVLLELPSPWYDTNGIQDKIKQARKLNCNIALDLTWLPISNTKIDIDLELVDEIYFSMNKCWPIVPLRPAMRWSKNRINDSQTFDTETGRYSKVGLNVFKILIDKFELDFTYDRYKEACEDLCNKFGLKQTEVLWFTSHQSAKHDNNHYISKHYYLDEFICLVELLNHKDKHFW